VCVHDATTWCEGCKSTAGVPPTFVHHTHATCTGHSCAYLGGHKRIWPWKSKPRLQCAFTPRPPCVEGANRRRGSPQHLCIPTTPLALAIRARAWVAIEVSGHGSPNHTEGVRPRHHHQAWRVKTYGGAPPNICASQPRRLQWPFVRVLGWPSKYLAIEVQTTPTVCVHVATTGCGGCKPTAGVPPSFVHPNHAACTGHSCA